MLDGFASSGAGRYIGGLVPDVIVRADGSISPITSYSWVSGFEIAPSKATGFYAYFSGLYGLRNTAVDLTGSFIGWGYPGAASNAADRVVEQATAATRGSSGSTRTLDRSSSAFSTPTSGCNRGRRERVRPELTQTWCSRR